MKLGGNNSSTLVPSSVTVSFVIGFLCLVLVIGKPWATENVFSKSTMVTCSSSTWYMSREAASFILLMNTADVGRHYVLCFVWNLDSQKPKWASLAFTIVDISRRMKLVIFSFWVGYLFAVTTEMVQDLTLPSTFPESTHPKLSEKVFPV